MKIERQGLAWGAAYQEAQPIRIKHGSAEIEVYIGEGSELIVEIPAGGRVEPAQVFNKSHGLRIMLRTDE